VTHPAADLRKKLRTRVGIFLLAVVAGLLLLDQNTLDRLAVVEAERDQWQRPAEVIAALNVKQGSAVADIGAGAGYFALKLSRAVGASGRVFAVDIQRLPLTFLWIRTIPRSEHNVSMRLGDSDDPHLPPNGLDAVLVANTYHEFANPSAILESVRRSLRSPGRLVVIDHIHTGTGGAVVTDTHHELRPEIAAAQMGIAGFHIIERRDLFIDRPSGERWWLIVATQVLTSDRKPRRDSPLMPDIGTANDNPH